MGEEKDWKLKLRYGKLKTPYKHYTAIVPVVINGYIKDFEASPGTAYGGFKVWALDTDEVVDIVESIAQQTNFVITGKIEIYITAPVQPPQEDAYAYDINFSYYKV